MTIGVSIDFPQAEANQLFASLKSAQKQLNMPLRASVSWAGRLLMQSLAARTILSEKKREIVDNPSGRHLLDGRVAPFGVMKWKDGKQYFAPVWRHGGKGGKAKYKSKAEAKSDRRVIIGRRGLAKASWGFASRVMSRGGAFSAYRTKRIGSVSWSGGSINPTVTISNQLRYMEHALKGGYSAIGPSMEAAANKMTKRIEQIAARELGAK